MPYYEEWEEILDTRSVPELIATITSDDEEGQRLRQSASFVGILTGEERDQFRGSREPEQ
jgi:hypothetical protein